MARYDRYWEMKTPNAVCGDEEMFKCTECGSETFPEKGFDGEPDTSSCHHDCKMDHGDWSPGGGQKDLYRKNFGQIFPNSPCANF